MSPNLTYNNVIFNKFNISGEEFDELSDDIIYKQLNTCLIRINEFKKVKSGTKEEKEEKAIVEDTVSEFYNEWISKLDNKKYDELSNAKKWFSLQIEYQGSKS